VHPNPEEKPLIDWLQGMEKFIGPHRIEELIEYPETRTEHLINANWKIVVENYIDGYHLAHLHSATLFMYEHQQQITGFEGPHFRFYEPLTSDYINNLDQMSPYPLINHFSDEQPMGAYVPMLFPNLGISATESSWSIFHVIPLTPNRCKVVTRTRLADTSEWKFQQQQRRSNKFFAKRSAKYKKSQTPDDPMLSGDFMAEDINVCEQQQKSLKSPLFAVGATAKYQEAAVGQYQLQIMKQLRPV